MRKHPRIRHAQPLPARDVTQGHLGNASLGLVQHPLLLGSTKALEQRTTPRRDHNCLPVNVVKLDTSAVTDHPDNLRTLFVD